MLYWHPRTGLNSELASGSAKAASGRSNCQAAPYMLLKGFKLNLRAHAGTYNPDLVFKEIRPGSIYPVLYAQTLARPAMQQCRFIIHYIIKF
jgi:hypothetical protein